MTCLSVHLLPSLVTPEELIGRVVVVIDVLRATTTIIHALSAGAKAIVPCLEVEEAREKSKRFPTDSLTGGERYGQRIAGFDLGNSPAEYTPDLVRGKTIFFTTTNGTRAMQRCRSAARILVGAFANLSALCDALAGIENLDLLCAGTDNVITREDVLFAGAVIQELHSTSAAASLNDQALIALDAWRSASAGLRTGPSGWLAQALRTCRGGRNLLEIGHERDIDLAARLDRCLVVPELDNSNWQITARNS
jgi:2-phosphosulfolactate phosphatase